jgi:type VI secretion system Hcp family effector
MSRPIIAAFALLALVGAPSIQAQQLVLRLGDIQGSSKIRGHEGWIPLNSSALKLKAPKRGTIQTPLPLELTRRSDSVSPALAEAAATGKKLGEAKVEWVGTAPGTTNQATLYTITLKEAVLESWSQSVSSDGAQENLSLRFRLLSVTIPVAKSDSLPATSSSTTLEPATAVALTDVMGRGEWVPGGAFKLYWPGLTGHVYQILSSPTLNGDFSLLREVSTPATGEASVELPGANPTHFFRILQVEGP